VILQIFLIDSTIGANSCKDFLANSDQHYNGWTYGSGVNDGQGYEFKLLPNFANDNVWLTGPVWYESLLLRGQGMYNMPSTAGT
jgi:hypothetical protein